MILPGLNVLNMKSSIDMIKKVLLLPILVISFSGLFAQHLPAAALNVLKPLEDSLKQASNDMANPDDEFIFRFKADSFFTRGFVNALKVPYSFYYPFDSLESVSKVYAPDSSFRIFTWEVMKDFTYYRQKGAIQFNTPDGALKLIPLFDVSDFTDKPYDSIRGPKNWIGAVYYRLIEKTYNNKKYYTLLGSDGNGARSRKKWMEVMTFDEKGNPQFGGRYFQYQNDEMKPKQPAYRFSLEYKKDAQVRLSYDKDLDKIIFDHLFSEDMTPELHYTLVPYGDYEAFVWKNGIWYHTATPFDNAPLKNDFVPKSLEKDLKKKGEQNQMIPPGQKDERVPHESKEKVKDDNTN